MPTRLCFCPSSGLYVDLILSIHKNDYINFYHNHLRLTYRVGQKSNPLPYFANF